jgi:hypothetical protein
MAKDLSPKAGQGGCCSTFDSVICVVLCLKGRLFGYPRASRSGGFCQSHVGMCEVLWATRGLAPLLRGKSQKWIPAPSTSTSPAQAQPTKVFSCSSKNFACRIPATSDFSWLRGFWLALPSYRGSYLVAPSVILQRGAEEEGGHWKRRAEVLQGVGTQVPRYLQYYFHARRFCAWLGRTLTHQSLTT